MPQILFHEIIGYLLSGFIRFFKKSVVIAFNQIGCSQFLFKINNDFRNLNMLSL